MRIFLAGATGAIGRVLVPRLVRSGHEVTALTRAPAKEDALRAAGASPVVGDVLDAAATERLVRAAAPDVVIAELTDLPKVVSVAAMRDAAERNDRLRRDGTRNLLAAARAAG